MKILHVVEATFAGVGRHVLDLAGEQAALGNEVHVIYSPVRESRSFAQDRSELRSVTWHSVPMSRTVGAGELRSMLKLRRTIKAIGADVVHGHSTKGGLVARFMGQRDAVIVYTPNAVYSMNPLLGDRARQLVSRLERRLSRRTSMIVAVSPEEESHLLSIGVAPSKIEVIPNGITPVEPADTAEVRSSLSLPVDMPVMGFVGRLSDQKAPLDLIKVFAVVAERDPSVHFAVVGDGPLMADVNKAVADNPALDGRLHILGEQPGTWAMSAFDVFVLPSQYEGFPYVLIEAAHLGIPIVTTVEACASLLDNGPARVKIADAGDIETLAAHSVEILGRAHGAEVRYDRRFTVEAMSKATLAVYTDAVARVLDTEERLEAGRR